jgi:alpha-amylase
MRWISLLLAFSCLCFIQCRSDSARRKSPNHSHRIYYQIFVRSFYDSDGDGIGDLKGLTQQLDYLEELGVEGLWLSPVHPSPSYHKYDVRDYYSIDPEYGTMEDFETLLTEAHQRDMKVLIDLVVNHTDDQHPWFQEALQGASNPFRSFYVWEEPADIQEHPEHWHQQPADGERQNQGEEQFYGFFWKGMPDLNYENPRVREEVKSIAAFWLEEVGVDGFRLDAALHIYPFYSRDRTENVAKTVAWWEEFRAAVKEIDPDAYLVGEVWEDESIIAPFLENGLDAAFDFELAKLITKTLKAGKDQYGFNERLLRIHGQYQEENPDFLDAIFLSNHDMNRIRSALDRDMDKSKLAASILLTLPGTPFIYYGEEIGMLGKKPDPEIREPLPWDMADLDPGQTDWTPLKYNSSAFTLPVRVQRQDQSSIWRHYQRLIGLRKSHPALSEGSFGPYTETEVPPSLLAFIRSSGREQLLVLHNLSRSPVVFESSEEWRFCLRPNRSRIRKKSWWFPHYRRLF